jgi:hypothetical protein
MQIGEHKLRSPSQASERHALENGGVGSRNYPSSTVETRLTTADARLKKWNEAP